MALFEAEHLKTTYLSDGKPRSPFEDVSFSLEAGSISDLTGPSGSGKTTLLRVCARLLPKTAGALRLDGQDSEGMSPVAWRRQVCLVPQQSVLVPGTVGDNLRLPWTLKVNAGAAPPADEELRALLRAVGREDVGCDTDASQLSGGQQARVAAGLRHLSKGAALRRGRRGAGRRVCQGGRASLQLYGCKEGRGHSADTP